MKDWIEFYNRISQTLYDHGAGLHYDAQIRADYRRGLAAELWKVLPELHDEETP